MAVRQQQRRGTAAQWTSANPILSPGEIGFEIDTNKFKIGDGTTRWASLIYFTADAAAALEDLIDGAPGLLDTLNELAAAVGDDANFFSTVTTNIATAKSEAISTSASDATTKANAAKSEAISTAAADATSKVAAEATARNTAIASAISTEVTNRNSAITTAVAGVVAAAPAALDTLKELADALTADESTASTLATLVGTKASSAQVAIDIAAEATARNTAIATAKTAAEATASSDATTKVAAEATARATAVTEAIATAATDATTKADAAKAFATAADTTLRTAVTSDIATAKSEAITAAASDATTKRDAAKTYADALIATEVTNRNSALDLKAPLASPALTGNPTAPTQTLGNDSTRVATTAFVKAAIQDIASLNLVLDGGGV